MEQLTRGAAKTRRHDARGDMEARLALLASIVDSSDDAIISKNLEGIVTSWNRGAEKIYGYSAEEMIGKPISLLIHPDHPEEMSTILQKIRSGEHVQLVETVRIKKGGGLLLVSLSESPIHDLEGNVIGVSSIARAAAHALRRNEEQLRELFMQAFDGIFIADLEGRYTDVNGAGCSLLGYTREEILGKTIVDLIPEAEIDRLWQTRTRMLDGGVLVEEWTLRRKDGSFVPVEVSAKILSDGRWLGFVRDIAERKRALEATRAMAQELERRVAQRTEQLRRLGAELEAAEDRERRKIARDLHDDIAQTLEAARMRLAGLCVDKREEVRSAANEIGALIDAANRSTRSLAAQLAPAVLYELGLCPALEWLGEEIERTFGLRVAVVDDGHPKPLAQAARSILFRATRELLINAAKYARTDTAVVETRREGEWIVVHVSDAGVGFDPAQVSAAPKRGLGLVSMRERLSFIGGTATVRSAPGDGTVAVLSAPLATDESLVAERNT